MLFTNYGVGVGSRGVRNLDDQTGWERVY